VLRIPECRQLEYGGSVAEALFDFREIITPFVDPARDLDPIAERMYEHIVKRDDSDDRDHDMAQRGPADSAKQPL